MVESRTLRRLVPIGVNSGLSTTPMRGGKVGERCQVRISEMRGSEKKIEALLGNNRRASVVMFLLSLLPVVLGVIVVASGEATDEWSLVEILGWTMVLFGGLLAMRQFVWIWTPRLACRGDELLVYLRGLRPTRVPLDAVECFFAGETDSLVPQLQNQRVTAAAVVVRLAERAKAWHERPVRRSLGVWANGYIQIRGTWTEPLSKQRVGEMNRRLSDIKRRRKAVSPSSTSGSRTSSS